MGIESPILGIHRWPKGIIGCEEDLYNQEQDKTKQVSCKSLALSIGIPPERSHQKDIKGNSNANNSKSLRRVRDYK